MLVYNLTIVIAIYHPKPVDVRAMSVTFPKSMWDWNVWQNAFWCSVVYSTQLVKEWLMALMYYSTFTGGFSYKNAASFCRRRQLQKRVECKFNQGVYAHLCKFCSALHHLPTKQYSMYNIVRTQQRMSKFFFFSICIATVFSQDHEFFQNIPIPSGVQIIIV